MILDHTNNLEWDASAISVLSQLLGIRLTQTIVHIYSNVR